jgi:hypothetical protein
LNENSWGSEKSLFACYNSFFEVNTIVASVNRRNRGYKNMYANVEKQTAREKTDAKVTSEK